MVARTRRAASAETTESRVSLLGAADRTEELARMLGGVEVSTEARAAARLEAAITVGDGDATPLPLVGERMTA